jgi:hypothetical protein
VKRSSVDAGLKKLLSIRGGLLVQVGRLVYIGTHAVGHPGHRIGRLAGVHLRRVRQLRDGVGLFRLRIVLVESHFTSPAVQANAHRSPSVRDCPPQWRGKTPVMLQCEGGLLCIGRKEYFRYYLPSRLTGW